MIFEVGGTSSEDCTHGAPASQHGGVGWMGGTVDSEPAVELMCAMVGRVWKFNVFLDLYNNAVVRKGFYYENLHFWCSDCGLEEVGFYITPKIEK